MSDDNSSQPNVTAIAAESAEPAFVDRRGGPRYQFTASVEMVDMSSRTTTRARTSDLSPGGCYVDTTSPLPVGTTVRMRLSKDNRSFEVQAKVVYSLSGMGMGLAFTAAVPEQLAVLKRWVGELRGELLPEFSGLNRDESGTEQDLSHVLGALLMELVGQGVLPTEKAKSMLSQLMGSGT